MSARAPLPRGARRDGRHGLRRGLRRGATLPLVCVLLTALLGASALAIDLGRLYHAGVEVQTAADAAALAAMRYHQYSISLSVSGVQAQAQWIASLNRAAGQAPQVAAVDVLPMQYDPATRAITAGSWDMETSAIQVTAGVLVPTVLAAALGNSAVTVRRTATAWLANVSGGECVRPFSFNYTRFYEEGVTWDSRYTGSGTYAPEFLHWDISSTQLAPLPGRTFIILPPGLRESTYDGAGYTNNGNWRPADFAGGGLTGFTSQIGAGEGSAACTAARAAVGDTKAALVADSANTLTAMHTGMAQLCNRAGNAPDAHCYTATGAVGVKTRVMLSDSMAVSGGFVFRVREVGVVRIMCYFRSSTDVCNDVPMNEPEVQGTWTTYGPRTGYPPGTIAMFLDTPGSTTLTSDLVLGNKPGLTQRLVLVR